jgi:glycosyltransferase involved in cell wall biosynthesis
VIEQDLRHKTLIPVTEQQWPIDEQIVLSVSCLAYNHESFIRDCIEGFLIQRTSFPIEILIHDDASTDGTAAIIAEYATKYPRLIKPIYQTENQLSKGVKVTRVYNTSRAAGAYIALCEGDDYWTDPFKLENQVCFLRENPEYSLIAENSMVQDLVNDKEYVFSELPETDLTIEQLLGKRIFGTASTMYRKKIVIDYGPELPVSGDIGLWCYLATKGKVRYFTRISSVYRRGLQGIVLGSHPYDWAVKMEIWNIKLRIFLKDPRYHFILRDRIFNEFWNAFIYGVRNREWETVLPAFSKCLYYRPIHFFLRGTNIALRKLVLITS